MIELPPPVAAAEHGQREASRPDASAWVSANAGSGKTKVLIDRVARLLLTGAEPDEILCVTYTRAAAMEMQARLYRRLGGWCVAEEEALAGELARLEGVGRDEVDPGRIGRARELFARALETPGGLRIETIHAFCARLLRRFPLEADIPPGFAEMDERQAIDLWREARNEAADEAARAGGALSEAFGFVARADGLKGGALDAVWRRRSDVLAWIDRSGGVEPAIEALKAIIGAGDESEAALLDRAMGPDLPRAEIERAIAALRGSGSKEDGRRASSLEAALGPGPAATRLESYLNAIRTGEGSLRKSIATKETITAHPDLLKLLGTGDPLGTETCRMLKVEQEVLKARCFERSAALLRAADASLRRYTAKKAAGGLLDFDDLIEATLRLLSDSASSNWVLWKLDGGLSHILLDEAQDTSPPQWAILKKLTEEFFAGAGARDGPPRTFFVVGDQKQSIYSFQGAAPERFSQERRELAKRLFGAEPTLLTPSLGMSFRSSPEILRFVDEVFETSAFDGEDPFSPAPPVEADILRHEAFRIGESGCVELLPITEPTPRTNGDPWDAPLDQETASSPKQRLAGDIARWIKREIDEGATVWDDGRRRPMHAGDVLVLVRKRSGGLFDALLQALKRAGLPVAGADRVALLDSLAVQDVLNTVRFALHPEDDLVLAEILTGPFVGFDLEADLRPIAGERGRNPLWTALKAAAGPRHASAIAWLQDLLRMRDAAPSDFLVRVLARPAAEWDSGWSALLARLGDPARDPVTVLVDRAAGFDAANPPSLQLFLREIERDGGEVKRELSGAAAAVRVMTVHGAKGLESPVVILPDMTSPPRSEKGAMVVFTEPGAPLWSEGSKSDPDSLARPRMEWDASQRREERRLLYVALTRARDRLLLAGHPYSGKPFAEDSWRDLCERAFRRLEGALAAPVTIFEDVPDGSHASKRFGPAPERAFECGESPAASLEEPGWLHAPVGVAGRTSSPAPTPASRESRRPLERSGWMAAERGRAIHTLLQFLPDAPRSQWKSHARQWLAASSGLPADVQRDALSSVLRVLSDERLGELFGTLSRAEAPIVGRIGGGPPIRGRIDRIAVTPEAVWILEYKSGAAPPSDGGSPSPAHLHQMAVYWGMARRIFTGRSLRALLIFTNGPTLCEIEPHELERVLNSR